jgi:hypothetical protein
MLQKNYQGDHYEDERFHVQQDDDEGIREEEREMRNRAKPPSIGGETIHGFQGRNALCAWHRSQGEGGA